MCVDNNIYLLDNCTVYFEVVQLLSPSVKNFCCILFCEMSCEMSHDYGMLWVWLEGLAQRLTCPMLIQQCGVVEVVEP